MRFTQRKNQFSLLTKIILSLAFLGLTSEFLLSDCYLLGLTWHDLQILKSEMLEMSGEFNKDILSQIVCIFHSTKEL